MIDRATMEAQFPGSRRTYLHLKDVEVCGGDLFSLRLQVAVDDDPIWKRLADARKSPLRQASLLGYDTVFFLLLRQLNLQNAETMVSKRLGIKGRVLVSPYAEIGMDVDKPFQLAMMREHLAKRGERDVASSD